MRCGELEGVDWMVVMGWSTVGLNEELARGWCQMWHPLWRDWRSVELPPQFADGVVMRLGELTAGGQGLVGMGRRQAVLECFQDFQEFDADGFDGLIDRATQEPPIGAGDAVPAGQQP